MPKKLEHILLIILYIAPTFILNHSYLYASQCNALTDYNNFFKENKDSKSNIPIIQLEYLSDAEFIFNKELRQHNGFCAIYFAKSFYHYKKMEKAKEYINIAYKNITNPLDEKCNEVYYYKLLIDPDNNFSRIYQKLKLSVPDLTTKLDLQMENQKQQIKKYLNNPWNNQIPVVNKYWAMHWTLYDTLQYISNQIDLFNQSYNNGNDWEQNEDNVHKLYDILKILSLKAEDKASRARYESFKNLQLYYNQVNKPSDNKLEKFQNYFLAIDSLQLANNNSWQHPPFLDTENAKEQVKHLTRNDLNIIKQINESLSSINSYKQLKQINLDDLLNSNSKISNVDIKNEFNKELKFLKEFSNLIDDTLSNKISFFNNSNKNCTSDYIDWYKIRSIILEELFIDIKKSCVDNIWNLCNTCKRINEFKYSCEKISAFNETFNKQKWNQELIEKMNHYLDYLKQKGVDVTSKKESIDHAYTYFSQIKNVKQFENSFFYSLNKHNFESHPSKYIASIYTDILDVYNQIKTNYPHIFEKINNINDKWLEKKETYQIMAEIDSIIEKKLIKKDNIQNIFTNKHFHLIEDKYKNFIILAKLYCENLERKILSDDDLNYKFIQNEIWNNNYIVGRDFLFVKKKETLNTIMESINYQLNHWNQLIKMQSSSFDIELFIKHIERIQKNYSEYFGYESLFIKLNQIANRIVQLKNTIGCEDRSKICSSLPDLIQKRDLCKPCNGNDSTIKQSNSAMTRDEWLSIFSFELINQIQQAEKNIKIPFFSDACSLWHNINYLPENKSSLTCLLVDYIHFLNDTEYSKNALMKIDKHISSIVKEAISTLKALGSLNDSLDLVVNKRIHPSERFPTNIITIPTLYEFVCRYFLMKWYFKHNQIAEANKEIKDLYLNYRLPKEINRLLCLLLYKEDFNKCKRYL